MTAADEDMTDRIGIAPALSVDPPGTCHMVGCPRKGEHPPHTFIGTADSFAPYDAPTLDNRPGQTTVPTSLLVRADSLLQAFVRGRIVSTTTVEPSMIEEAQLLSEAFRKATSGAGR